MIVVVIMSRKHAGSKQEACRHYHCIGIAFAVAIAMLDVLCKVYVASAASPAGRG